MRRFWNWLTRRPVTLRLSHPFGVTAGGRPVAGVTVVSWSRDPDTGVTELVFTVRTPFDREAEAYNATRKGAK